MKKKTILYITLSFILLSAAGARAATPRPGLAGTPVASLVLLPGDSRSVELEYDDVLWKYGSFNMTIISAIIPDNQIHYLRINLTPRGDGGADLSYFSIGGFIYTNAEATGFLQFLEPRLTYGGEATSYIIDVYPAVSAGIIFSAVLVEYQDFDFPFKMTLTATLSN